MLRRLRRQLAVSASTKTKVVMMAVPGWGAQDRQVGEDWIVVLEATAGASDLEIDLDSVLTLMEAVADCRPTALHNPDRYALQLHIPACGPAEALYSAVARWRQALDELGLPSWEMARAEVLTPEELDRDFELPPVDLPPVGPVTVGRQVEDGLLRRAFYDSLTGLANPGLFRDDVEQALIRSRRGGGTHALLFVDLDDFGRVARSCAPATSEALLASAANRVRESLRPGDTAGRLGPDEFGVLLEDSSEGAATTVVRRLLREIRHVPVPGGGVLTASAGVAMSRPDDDADDLLERARLALEAAKAAGKGRHELFAPGMDELKTSRADLDANAVVERLAYVDLLACAALAANQGESLEQAAKVVLVQVCAQTGWDVGRLYVVDGERLRATDTCHCAARERLRAFGEEAGPLLVQSGAGLPESVLATGEPQWMTDLRADPRFSQGGAADSAGLRMGAAFPVLVGSEVVAVLEFLASQITQPDPALLSVLTSVGTQLGRLVERERAQAAVERSEERLRTIADAVLEAIVSVDRAGEIVAWSRGAASIFGYDEAEVLSRPVTVVVPDLLGDASPDIPSLLSSVNALHVETLELAGLRRDGTWFPAEVTVSSWDTADGCLFTLVVRDTSMAQRRRNGRAQRRQSGRAAASVTGWPVNDNAGRVARSS